MRELKFRGMCLNGEWVYGLLSHSHGYHSHGQPNEGYYISNNAGQPWAYAVRPETIGQYTGLKDKEGTEIYEGDILAYTGWDKKSHRGPVEFYNGSFILRTSPGFSTFINNAGKNDEVVGIIHE